MDYPLPPGAAGQISIVFQDSGRPIQLYFFTYDNVAYLLNAWNTIPAVSGFSVFEARLFCGDGSHETKLVSAEWITRNCGSPIEALIHYGRQVANAIENPPSDDMNTRGHA